MLLLSASDGKTPFERRFGEPFSGPILPFGWMIGYRPIFVKDQSRLHQFGKKKKVLSGHLHWKCVACGGGICGHRRHGKFGRVRNSRSETQCERGSNAAKAVTHLFPCRRWNSQVGGKRSGFFFKSTSIQNIPARGEEHNDVL